MDNRMTSNKTTLMSRLAAAMGISQSLANQPRLPYMPGYMPLPFSGKGGTRRKTKINRTSVKCNDRKPFSEEKIGHLNDVLYTYFDIEADKQKARVICRRCNEVSTINVRTKPYTQNKKVLAARAEAA
jgi:hypothetical protein